MFRRKTQQQGLMGGRFYLTLNIFLVLSKFIAEFCCYIGNHSLICNYFYSSENYDALYIKSPIPLFSCSFIIYTNRHFIAFFKGLNTVSAFAAMKIYTPVSLVIKVVHR